MKKVVDEIRRAKGWTEDQAKEACEAVRDAIHGVLAIDSSPLRYHGLGVFRRKWRNGRRFRSPISGQVEETTGRDVITFKASEGAD